MTKTTIADYFIPAKRSMAISVYALGIPLGGMVAYVFGGYIADSLDGETVSAVLRSWGWIWPANALLLSFIK